MEGHDARDPLICSNGLNVTYARAPRTPCCPALLDVGLLTGGVRRWKSESETGEATWYGQYGAVGAGYNGAGYLLDLPLDLTAFDTIKKLFDCGCALRGTQPAAQPESFFDRCADC